MNLTVQTGSYSFFRKAETPQQAVDFLNEVSYVGGIISIHTHDAHYCCDFDDVYDIVKQWGIYKCRKGACSAFQTHSPGMLCGDCYEEMYRPDNA